LSTTEKIAMVEPANEEIPIVRQCELIGLPRSTFYSPPRMGESAQNLGLMRLIDEEYTAHPFYGTRQMRNVLQRRGHSVNRKHVRRLMQRMGICSIAPKPNTSAPRKEHVKYPYLLGGLDVNRSNLVWCSDITYIRMPGGFVYLTAVMDWYSRRVLSWEISTTLDDSFCVSALESAMRRYGVPEIFNTDQGSQYTSADFIEALKSRDIRVSMDGKGRAMDNIFIERLWRSVKYEEIYLKEYGSVAELVRALKKYFEFYNAERPHQSFGGRTPDEVYNDGLKLEEVA
jgi:putative transposase